MEEKELNPQTDNKEMENPQPQVADKETDALTAANTPTNAETESGEDKADEEEAEPSLRNRILTALVVVLVFVLLGMPLFLNGGREVMVKGCTGKAQVDTVSQQAAPADSLIAK